MDKIELPKGPAWWPVVLAFVVATVFWFLNAYIGLRLGAEERGVFGDMFGAVNSLFSGFAFVGVVYAITMQRHEITIARQDIRYTKQILDEQTEHLEQQNAEARKQAFEATFFQLLDLFSNLVNQMDLEFRQGIVFVRELRSPKEIVTGKDVFPIFNSELRAEFPEEEFLSVEFDTCYHNFYIRRNSELGHYFRTIYNIFKFIDAANIPDKRFYTNLVRAQLSDAEVALLFHNGLSEFGREKFKPLMERYALLKNINDNDLLHIKLKDKYDPGAFD